MDVRDLAPNELADKDVGALRDSFRYAEDLMTVGMPPPTASDRATHNRLGKTRHGAACGLEHYAMAFDEGQSLLRGHCASRPRDALVIVRPTPRALSGVLIAFPQRRLTLPT